MASAVLALVAVVVAVGLSLALLASIAQRRHLAQPPRRSRRALPVSVLKPLKGADPDLAANLRSFFGLDHPAYELVFAARDEDDPALAVVEALRREHPEVDARVVVSTRSVGLNPKVDNLANAAAAARHELLLVSDSNVRVGPGYLSDMVARIEDEGVGLVSSLIRGTGGSGAGAALERLQLNTFVMGGISALATVVGKPAVVGKSMLLRRRDLERIGGWRFLGVYLAEDQVCGEEIARLGLRLDVSGAPVDNVLGRLSVREFVQRHLRWARIRRHVSPPGYAAELLLNPFAVSLAGLAAAPGPGSAALSIVALLAMSALAAAGEQRLGLRRPLAACVPLEAARSLLVAAAWPVPFFSSRIRWRGNDRLITRRTRLIEEPPARSPRPRWDVPVMAPPENAP